MSYIAYIPSKMYRSYISEVSSVSVYNIFPLAFKANYIFFSNFKVNESKGLACVRMSLQAGAAVRALANQV